MMIAQTARETDMICCALVFSLKYKSESRNALTMPRAEVRVEYTVRDISAIAKIESRDEALEAAVRIRMFMHCLSGSGFIASFTVAFFERIKPKSEARAIITIIILVIIKNEPESVTDGVSVKSFSVIVFAELIKKNAMHTGIVALWKDSFDPISGITRAVNISTEAIIATIVSEP